MYMFNCLNLFYKDEMKNMQKMCEKYFFLKFFSSDN